MEQKKRKWIVNIVACAAKMTSVAIPIAAIEVLFQDVIDIGKELCLEKFDNMPLPKGILSNLEEHIQNAVIDILDEMNVFFEDEIYSSSARIASKLVKESKVIKLYSREDTNIIENALEKYLEALKEWAVQQPELLKESLEYLESKIKRCENDINKITRRIETQQNQIDEISNATGLKTNILDLEAIDCFLEGKDKFYQYFFTDPSFTVDTLFLCQNYKKLILSENCKTIYESQKKLTDEILKWDEILDVIQSQSISLITGMYGTGKTALLKKLHLELCKNSDNGVFYFHAKDLKLFIDDVRLTDELGGGRKAKVTVGKNVRLLHIPH